MTTMPGQIEYPLEQALIESKELRAAIEHDDEFEEDSLAMVEAWKKGQGFAHGASYRNSSTGKTEPTLHGTCAPYQQGLFAYQIAFCWPNKLHRRYRVNLPTYE